jgi:23S rRNA-/tRNA-specific pseudouridylate synthase
MLTYEINPRDHFRRLESFLRNLLPASSLGYPRKLIKNGAVRLNGTIATPDTILTLHDTVTLKESVTLKGHLSTTFPAVDILYEDSQIAILNKPAGLPMHRTAELEHDLVEQVTRFMAWRDTPCKLYPVNRLDRGTSGTVILAKSSTAAGIYGRQVKETGLDKLYLALVEGTPDKSGIINQPLDGKDSETRFELMITGNDCTFLSVVPISGRMHQIRRHLAMIGHPVLGDRRYGSGDLPGMVGFALHSFRTVLVRPENAGALTVYAPLPEAFLALCVQSGIEPEKLFEWLKTAGTV